MKKLLNLDELSTRQKLGMTLIGFVARDGENLDYILELVRDHALGAVWVPQSYARAEEYIKIIKDAADYPILAFCDAGSGIGKYRIGKINSLGTAASDELSYLFGKAVGVTARKMGYDVVCNPVLDMVERNMPCSMTERSLGNDKEKVAALAIAMVRGMHDGGVLSVAKHYPGSASGDYAMDSHMAETYSDATREELLDYNLYPYRELLRLGLLDGIMTKHTRFVAIDADYPASMSKKVIGIIRDEGFDGFAMTDALCMMGVLAKFGKSRTLGLSVGNGNDFALPYNENNRFCYEAMLEAYKDGIISNERLDEAVRRVLEAQAKAAALSRESTMTAEEDERFNEINLRSIYAVTDDGVSTAISRDGRHFFVVLIDQYYVMEESLPAVDTITTSWYKPDEICARLKEYFPRSRVDTLRELPTRTDATRVLEENLEYDDVVFITYFNGGPYIGVEKFTPRIISIMEAMQYTARISAVLHLGNPFVLEDIPHVPRIIFGKTSSENAMTAIDVLAGIQPALGSPTYDVRLK